MAGGSSRKKWLNRFGFSSKDSSKSQPQDASSQDAAVFPSAANPVAGPVRATPSPPAAMPASVPQSPAIISTRVSPAETPLSSRLASEPTKEEAADASLWDKAYDALKEEKPDITTAYEELLSKVLVAGTIDAATAPSSEADDAAAADKIPQHDVVTRRERLKQITELGLKHMEDKKVGTTLLGHEIVLQDVVTHVAGAVEWAEDYIKDAVKDLPYASIVMAGVSLVLPLLKNPTAAEAANKEGFTYVTSQMRYYAAMESLLLPEKMDLKADMAERLADLYQHIIDFQIQSILRFYRSRTKNYFRGTVNYDSWDKKLQDIKDEDKSLVAKFETATSASSLHELRGLSQKAEASRRALDDLLTQMKEQVAAAREQVALLQKIERHITDPKDHACLQDLQTTDPRDDKSRIESTKGGLLKDSYSWILENDDFRRWREDPESRLLWIKGDPGKGKTMLLCGIIDELIAAGLKGEETAAVSFFFCQATDARINNAAAVLRGLIFLLVEAFPPLLSHVRERYDKSGKQLFEGVNAWEALSKMFENILADPRLKNEPRFGGVYLVIDALDECIEDRDLLMELIVQKSSLSRVKWIVSSRNWPSIERELDSAEQKVRLQLELNEESVSAAVAAYVQFKVSRLATRNRYDAATRDKVHSYLLENAMGTFLWVALVCQELTAVSKWNAMKKLTSFPPGLNALYRRMLDQICNSEDAELCQRILAVVSLVARPLTLEELGTLVELPEGVSDDSEALAEIVGLCGSFLTLREGTIAFVHQSASDFLRTVDEIFPSGRSGIHYSIVVRSLDILSRTLRRDIYGLGVPSCNIASVQPPRPDPLVAARYSCIYWVHHLILWNLATAQRSSLITDASLLDEFLRTKFLYWLEALSLCRSLSASVSALRTLQNAIEGEVKPDGRASEPAWAELVRDALRFVMYHKTAIETYPLQAYMSALIFSPTGSPLRRIWEKEEPTWMTIKPAMAFTWSACLQTLEEHDAAVLSVAFSHDSRWLASGSTDGTVRLWNAATGDCVQTLRGHEHFVNSVAFSHDSLKLASASDDGTVRIWDMLNGKCIRTLEIPVPGCFALVAISHNGGQLAAASASGDYAVYIWDVANGKHLHTLQRVQKHSYPLACLGFTHDSTRLTTAWHDGAIVVWDARSGTCRQTVVLEEPAHSVAFSDNKKRHAWALYRGEIQILDADTNECLQTITDAEMDVTVIALSYDATRLAVSSSGRIMMWDVNSVERIQELDGHRGEIRSIAFSHDSTRLVSASDDGAIKIWDISSGMTQAQEAVLAHYDPVEKLVFSDDSSLLASKDSHTVMIWDTASCKCLQRFSAGHLISSGILFSHDSKWVALVLGMTVQIRDVQSGNCLHTIRIDDDDDGEEVVAVAFSQDSQLLATSSDCVVAVWDTNSGGRVFEDMEADSVSLLTFSYDSAWLAWAAEETVRICDARTGDRLQTFVELRGPIAAVAFSRDSARLASATDFGIVQVWDTRSGDSLQTVNIGPELNAVYMSLHSISFDASGSQILTEIGTITIDALSISNTPEHGVAKPRSLHYKIPGPTLDGMWILYNLKHLIWLPSEYRGTCSAASGKTLAIGSSSGRVWIYRFDLDEGWKLW